VAAPVPARAPVSTYRLQLNPDFPFAAAEHLVPYLERLGITDCYCSPVLAAAPGSRHGYDVCDHTRLNPDLGGEEGFRSFADALKRAGLGLILDFVPNHMSVHPEANLWWCSVLENGPSSEFATFFDIDWDPVKPELKGKVLLPILGEQYGDALESGLLRLQSEAGAFWIRYGEVTLPLNPRQLGRALRHNLEALERTLGPDDPALNEFRSILYQFDHLPVYTTTDPALMVDRRREKEVARQRLARVSETCPAILAHIDAAVRAFNGVRGDRRSFDLLHELLELQAYRLSSWRTATHEINYRRFFDVNELAGIRVELPEVFDQVHVRLAEMLRRGEVTGVRLDHVDGLHEPAAYFAQLLAAADRSRAIYLVVEKIVSDGEPLRPDWQVHGTTGYGFLNDLNGLFVDSRQAHAFRNLYERFTGRTDRFAEIVYESKKLIISASMASELNVLAHELNRISEGDRRFRDFTLDSLQEALREVVACFPVYRTYVSEAGWSEFDEQSIDVAVSEALRRNPALEPTIFHFIRMMLLPERTPEVPPEEWERQVRFAMKFQQYTGPVHAKGVEDTAFYRHAPLLSLNEVGGEPTRFGRPPASFHRANLIRVEHWPLAMLATSTHDTKRGEDARARINVLSELPGQWRTLISRWARVNASARTEIRGEPAPDRGDEYLFYQALLGAWPAGLSGPPERTFVDRMRNYLLKAIKEAKIRTSWINPSRDYDDAAARFVERVLAGPRTGAFLKLFLPFAQRVARFGMVNSLSELVLKIASPGVPDFYQGSELWNLALVDPDNRRPVDFARRIRWLDQMEPWLAPDAAAGPLRAAVSELLERWEDGGIKLFYTATGLRLRRRLPGLFLRGAYVPLEARGEKAEHVMAFGRADDEHVVVALAPRLVATMGGPGGALPIGPAAWHGTLVPIPDEWSTLGFRNQLTGDRVPLSLDGSQPILRVGDALSVVPAALLVADRRERADA
jgi:(1->4)-alpha-D-glucan 1-alpha-D-glucosylmutase